MATDNWIAKAYRGYQRVIPAPAAQAALVGGLAYGAGSLLWNPMVSTMKSLGRRPVSLMTGMPVEEWDAAMEEMRTDPKYKRWLPLVLGATAAVGSTALTYKPSKVYGGQFSWNARNSLKGRANNVSPQSKTQSDLYNDSVNSLDFSELTKAIDAKGAVDLFNNDPALQNNQYARNMGTAIVMNAVRNEGTYKPTLGGIMDSAADKLSNKLSFDGIVSVGAGALIANAQAQLFAGALGTLMTLTPSARERVIETGTWAGAITSILK